MYAKFKKLKLKQSRRIVAACLLVSILAVSGAVYGYSLSQQKSIASSKSINQDKKGSPTINTPTPPTDKPTAEEGDTEIEEPAPTAPTAQPKATGPTNSTAPEVYRPQSLQVSEVRASGDAFCDGTTYKLALQKALIFTNGRPGTVNWTIEGQRFGAIETVATGLIQIAENQHTYEFPLNYMYYMTQPISTDGTATRFRVTSPNNASSSWIYPSEILSGDSPCAWPN